MARRAMLVARGVAIGLVVLLFALLAWSLASEEGGGLAAAAARGERPAAPNFTLETLDGERELTLSALLGKGVVVNFWASWCIPCREEAPFLEEVWQENRDRGLVVVGVDANDFRADARRFVEKYGMTFPIVFDGPGDVLTPWGVRGFPETFVLDREGRAIAAFSGAVNVGEERERLLDAIEKALA